MRRILIGLLFLVPSMANAEMAISTAWDGRHDTGRNYTEIRYIDTDLFFAGEYYEFGWAAFAGTESTLGVELYVPLENWELGIGVEKSDYADRIVETEWKYEVRLGYNFTKHVSAQIFHKSNCRGICSVVPGMSILPHGSDDKANKGLNYAGLMFRW